MTGGKVSHGADGAGAGVSREETRAARSATAGCSARGCDTRAKGASRDAPVTVILPADILPADMVAGEPRSD